MATLNKSISVVDYYYSFLENLNSENKLELIAKLSNSIKNNSNKKTTSLQSLFGAYKSEETADEIIAEIKSSRTFNRKTELF